MLFHSHDPQCCTESRHSFFLPQHLPLDCHQPTAYRAISFSPGPAAGMDATRIAKVSAESKPATTTANNFRIDDGTDEADCRTAARFPFFHLPRELRDEIYDLVAVSARTTYYDIVLEANRQPRTTAYVTRGDSQFEVEFTAAVQRRVRSLLVGGDRSGLKLRGPDPREGARDPRKRDKAEHHWLEGSQGQRADGSYGLNIHALILVVPLNPTPFSCEPCSTVVFTFRFPGQEELGSRQRFDACWVGDSGKLGFPEVDRSAGQELLSIAQKVVWTGSIREYMMWRRYVVRYMREEAS